MTPSEIFVRLAVALGLGLLIGLQRERTAPQIAGIRTFPLTTVLGSLGALFLEDHGAWILAAGMISLAALLLISNLAQLHQPDHDPGLTTEVTMLLMYALGAYLMVGEIVIGVVIAGSVAVLLHLKPQMHALAGRLKDDDFKSIITFVLISLVILPVLPNRAYGPYAVLNPFKIWLMVVLIVAMSLSGYILSQHFGPQVGAWAGGVLGGLVSSTATTVSYSRWVRQNPDSAPTAAKIISIASAVVLVRVLVIVALVSPGVLSEVWLPMSVLCVVMLAVTAAVAWRHRATPPRIFEQKNPTELRSAIGFAAIFALILFGVAAAKERFGEGGLYFAAALSGLTDMDAITLSTANMHREERIAAESVPRLIVIANAANLLFKIGVVSTLGTRRLARLVAFPFAAVLILGFLLVRLG